MLVNPPEGWERPTPTSTPTSTQLLWPTNNSRVIELVKVIGDRQLSVKELMMAFGLKDRKNFIEYTLAPAIKQGFVRLLYPNSPRHPRQKYLLTVKGLTLYNQLK